MTSFISHINLFSMVPSFCSFNRPRALKNSCFRFSSAISMKTDHIRDTQVSKIYYRINWAPASPQITGIGSNTHTEHYNYSYNEGI